MTQEEIGNILNDCNKLLENCSGLDAELKEMDRCKEFLINEYKTNKKWFRLEPGKVTVEDAIRRVLNSDGLREDNSITIRKSARVPRLKIFCRIFAVQTKNKEETWIL